MESQDTPPSVDPSRHSTPMFRPPGAVERLPSSGKHWIATQMLDQEQIPQLRPVWQPGTEPGRPTLGRWDKKTNRILNGSYK